MKKEEVKGIIKGLGIGFIISAFIVYAMILNIKMDYQKEEKTDTYIIDEARELGMIFISEVNNIEELTEDYIIKMAKSLGMVFKEENNN